MLDDSTIVNGLIVLDENGYLIKGVLTEIEYPGNAFYISFDELPKKATNTDDSMEMPLAVTNTTTGVKLKASTTVLPDSTTLSVEKITSGTGFNSITTILGNDTGTFIMYNISLNSNGVTVSQTVRQRFIYRYRMVMILQN